MEKLLICVALQSTAVLTINTLGGAPGQQCQGGAGADHEGDRDGGVVVSGEDCGVVFGIIGAVDVEGVQGCNKKVINDLSTETLSESIFRQQKWLLI